MRKHAIRKMFDIPKDWESRPPLPLDPAPVPEKDVRRGAVPIEYEGVPASPVHRLYAHAIDFVLAGGIAAYISLLGMIIPAGIVNRTVQFCRVIYDHAGVHYYRYMPYDELLARISGFGFLVNLGIPVETIYWAVTVSFFAWIFVSVAPSLRGRSPGQQECNLAVLDATGREAGFFQHLVRMAGGAIGVLTCGVLAYLSYFWGSAHNCGLIDSLTGTRVVTYRGNAPFPARGERVINISPGGARADRGSAARREHAGG